MQFEAESVRGKYSATQKHFAAVHFFIIYKTLPHIYIQSFVSRLIGSQLVARNIKGVQLYNVYNFLLIVQII